MERFSINQIYTTYLYYLQLILLHQKRALYTRPGSLSLLLRVVVNDAIEVGCADTDIHNIMFAKSYRVVRQECIIAESKFECRSRNHKCCANRYFYDTGLVVHSRY